MAEYELCAEVAPGSFIIGRRGTKEYLQWVLNNSENRNPNRTVFIRKVEA
jgi:hypothetical protein